MNSRQKVYEDEDQEATPDPDEVSVSDRRLVTQSYDLVVEALLNQIDGGTIFLRPLSDRPSFQRHYVWSDTLASRLIESILLKVPIPPCYFSQNEKYELDVIDGQQRLYSIHRFVNNEFALRGLEVFTELNGQRFHQIPPKLKRQLETHTLRCVLVTNESHPEIKFDVFQRLNTNTVPLNAQELRHCVNRGALVSLLERAVEYEPWLAILRRRKPDSRMRDEELALRFFAFHLHGIKSYRTPQKHWLNETAKEGKEYSKGKIDRLHATWKRAIDTALVWFEPEECFRRLQEHRSRTVNRALFDVVMWTAVRVEPQDARRVRSRLRTSYSKLLKEDVEFQDLISRAIDHVKRTRRRFEIWNRAVRYVP